MIDRANLLERIREHAYGPPTIVAQDIRKLANEVSEVAKVPVVLSTDLIAQHMKRGTEEEQLKLMMEQVSHEVQAMVEERMDHLVHVAALRLKHPMPRPPWWLREE